MARDYYEILGVGREASADEIKKAYRKLAHTHHPDKSGGDEEKFKEINEAYQTLSNEEKRAQYNQYGQTFENGGGPQGNPFAGFSGGSANFDFNDLGGINDIFEQFFGGGQGRQRARRGQDVAIDMTISFRESAEGVKRETSHRIHQACSRCHGSGAEPNTPIVTCPRCKGRGAINQNRQTPFGLFQQSTPCPECEGEGKKPETLCTKCRGEGRVLEARTLDINIPAGIADGQTIRITGKGEVPSRGGVAGDLYVNVHVQPDKQLKRVRDDVHSDIDISFTEAALGTHVAVATLQGEEEIKIPAGTQPGADVRLRHQGFPHLSGSAKGDHIVTIHIEVPKKLSREQKQLLKDFQATEHKRRSFF